jgi:hypothetical protein
VRARRRARRAHEIAAALSKTRSVFIEVPKSEATPRGSVHFELTPHLTACLAAAGSGSLSGFRSPDAVMMAMEIEAAWASMGEPAMPEDPRHRSRLIATRELVVIRSTFPPCESAKVQLRGLLEAHRSNPEGEPLYCAAEGSIQAGAGPSRRYSIPARTSTGCAPTRWMPTARPRPIARRLSAAAAAGRAPRHGFISCNSRCRPGSPCGRHRCPPSPGP